MKIRKKLKILRAKFDLSQKELADKIGCSRWIISRWENGYENPNKTNKQKIKDLFNISL